MWKVYKERLEGLEKGREEEDWLMGCMVVLQDLLGEGREVLHIDEDQGRYLKGVAQQGQAEEEFQE